MNLRQRAAFEYADRLRERSEVLLWQAISALEKVVEEDINGGFRVTKTEPDAKSQVLELDYGGVSFRILQDGNDGNGQPKFKVLCRRENSYTPVTCLADIGAVFKEDPVPISEEADESDDSHSTDATPAESA